MKRTQQLLIASALSILIASTSASLGQEKPTQAPVKAVKDITATRESLALSYPEGVTLSIKFHGTHRLPKSSGEAKVERKRGMTEIEIELDEMKPAFYFGGDYNTYVLWIVSPEGHVDNVGEFVLQGNRSKLNVSTPLETFGMFITAEPHFLVGVPSRFVVMENTRTTQNVAGGLLKTSQIKYREFEGVYNFDRETLASVSETKGELRADVEEAITSIELAVRAGAEKFAPQELAKAREAMRKTEGAASGGTDKRNLMLLGHEVVRLAVEAQKLAEERSFQAALDAERKAHSDEAARLAKSIQDAQSEAERARLQAEQRELQLRIEEKARQEAMKRAEEAALRAADEERMRREAEERTRQAQDQAQQLARAKTESDLAAERARDDAERARKEREEAHARMQQALSVVVETRETARGLVLNLPDILFDFNKSTLKPQAREVLSKISGILLVAKGYRLSVEGHADNIGSDEYNQALSEKRAQSVRDYLLQSGLPLDMVPVARGLGESQPIAPNTSAEGRQKNRRVEIVVEDTQKTQGR